MFIKKRKEIDNELKKLIAYFEKDNRFKYIFTENLPLAKNTKKYLFRLQEQKIIKLSKKGINRYLRFHCSRRKYLEKCNELRIRVDLETAKILPNTVIDTGVLVKLQVKSIPFSASDIEYLERKLTKQNNKKEA